MTRLMAIMSRMWRALGAAALIGAGLAPSGVVAQGFEPTGAVCRAPSAFCGRTVQSTCLSMLGAGAVDSQVASLECRNQLSTYRDCLTLVARQCGVSAPAAEAAPSPGEATAAAPASPTMLAIWNEVKDSGDADALEAFAEAYPASPLATLARNRAASLREEAAAAAATPAPKPAPAALDDAARAADAAERARNREAQAHLARTGYEPGLADGVWGQRSSTALRAFSRDHALPTDGVLTEAHLAALRAAPDAPKRPAARPEAPSDPAPRPDREAAAKPADEERPAGAPSPGTVTVEVRYKQGLTFKSKRCQAPVPRDASGAFVLNGVSVECLAPIRLTGKAPPGGPLEGASLTFDGLHDAELKGTPGSMTADFGLIGPRDIMAITVKLTE